MTTCGHGKDTVPLPFANEASLRTAHAVEPQPAGDAHRKRYFAGGAAGAATGGGGGGGVTGIAAPR
jgi:hypothetical protein